MKSKLSPRLSSADWKDFCNRFHFSSGRLPHIKAVYRAMLPLVEAYAYYSLAEDLKDITFSHYAYGFVTLGKGSDELSELYLEHEQIEEAYMVDCISLVLLSKAYEEFAQAVGKQTGLYPSELSFLGDRYSMNLLPQIYASLSPDGIQITDGQMLMPLKTAVLILGLDARPHSDIHKLCNSCAACKNLSCPSRKKQAAPLPHTYGAMQIFQNAD